MPEWLFDIISAAEPERRPDFARLSAVNWLRALDHEVTRVHGQSATSQWNSLAGHFGNIPTRAIPHEAAVFEPLFASLTYTSSLVTAAMQPHVDGWRAPGAVVEWYYAVYNAARAMLAAHSAPAAETHAAVADRFANDLRGSLPHPFNMHAPFVRNEEFAPQLPSYPQMRPRRGPANPLSDAFASTERQSQEMLLAYLSGSARYYTWRIKQDIMRSSAWRKGGWTDFRPAGARALRNARLSRKDFNFLHLAFRYRGKANYRDAIFLAYGHGQLTNAHEYIAALANVARAFFFCAATYVEKRVGNPLHTRFWDDLKVNFGGIGTLQADIT